MQPSVSIRSRHYSSRGSKNAASPVSLWEHLAKNKSFESISSSQSSAYKSPEPQTKQVVNKRSTLHAIQNIQASSTRSREPKHESGEMIYESELNVKYTEGDKTTLNVTKTELTDKGSEKDIESKLEQ